MRSVGDAEFRKKKGECANCKSGITTVLTIVVLPSFFISMYFNSFLT